MKCKICGAEMVKHYPQGGVGYNHKTGKIILEQKKQHWLCKNCLWIDLE